MEERKYMETEYEDRGNLTGDSKDCLLYTSDAADEL